jgi:lipid II:glycine glycyltransferase (peptidoglycan interpeptide bridge formation enzyme)
MWNTFYPSGMIELLMAKYEGKIIGAIINSKFKDRVSGEFEAWNKKYRNISPVHFLIWEAIKRAHFEGHKIFDMGRTNNSNISLLKFKERWGTEVTILPQYYYPADKKQSNEENGMPMTQKIVTTISKLTPTILFPTLGRFCYRHMG